MYYRRFVMICPPQAEIFSFVEPNPMIFKGIPTIWNQKSPKFPPAAALSTFKIPACGGLKFISIKQPIIRLFFRECHFH